MAKKLNDTGGLLVGKTDKDNGKGIEIITPEGKIIAGGGEVVINEAASKIHCEELSKINQSTGGVAIPCDVQKTANKGPMKDGGKINPVELEKGIKDEEHHRATFEALATGKITIDQAMAETAKDHLKENPEFYKDQTKMETKENGGEIQAFYKKGDRVNITHTKTIVGTVENVITVGATIKHVKVKWDHGDTDMVDPKVIEKNFEPEPNPDESKTLKEVESRAKSNPINTPTVKDWNKIPAPWKNTKTINEVKYINSPYDKGLLNILKPFFGTDALRPIMGGVNFDEHGITVTDAHKLIHLPYPNAKYKGTYATGPMGAKGIGSEEIKKDLFTVTKYPNYPAIIPEAKEHTKFEFSVYKLLQYTKVAQKYSSKITHQVVYKFGEQLIGFNSDFLIEILEAALKLGHEKMYVFIRKPNNAVIFSPDEKFKLGKSEIFLLMPVMIQDAPVGAADLDFSRELNVYFDFSDNNIHNSDGSPAEFKMNYGEYSVLDSNIIDILSVYEKQNRKSVIPILEYFAVEKGKIQVSDLETFTEVNIDNKLKDGLYKVINDAIEFDAFGDIDNYPKAPEFRPFDYKFVISAGILKYYLDKADDYRGNDDLRPIMNGFNIKYEAGKMILFATNAHILFKADITRYVEVSKDQIDFSIVLSRRNLIEYLDYVGEQPIVVKANKEQTVINSDSGMFYSRNIDGKYPNAEAVIPKNNEKELTINIKDLYNCIKTPDAIKFVKDHKKNEPMIYDKISSTPGHLDIYVAYSEKDDNKEWVIAEEVKVCTVPYEFKEKAITTSENIILIMPVRNPSVNYFCFGYRFFKTILDTCSSESIAFEFNEPNRAYIIDGECFVFSKTIPSKKAITKPKTPQAEWRDKIKSLKEIKNNPFATEAIETLEMLLGEKMELGGQIKFEPIQTPLD